MLDRCPATSLVAMLSLLLSASTACADESYLIQPGEKFQADSEMRSVRYENFGTTHTWEVGTYNGVPYEIFPGDASGEVGSWKKTCESDAMTDERRCVLRQGDLWVAVDAGGPAALGVGDSHYPGSQILLRIDDAAPTTGPVAGFTGAEAKALVEQLLAGTRVRTRYTRWPDTTTTDGEADPRGLREGIAIAQWVIALPAQRTSAASGAPAK